MWLHLVSQLFVHAENAVRDKVVLCACICVPPMLSVVRTPFRCSDYAKFPHTAWPRRKMTNPKRAPQPFDIIYSRAPTRILIAIHQSVVPVQPMAGRHVSPAWVSWLRIPDWLSCVQHWRPPNAVAAPSQTVVVAVKQFTPPQDEANETSSPKLNRRSGQTKQLSQQCRPTCARVRQSHTKRRGHCGGVVVWAANSIEKSTDRVPTQAGSNSETQWVA